ncbi:MAG: phosphotransacetylase family protein [Desulfoplanes sp.]
MTGLYIGSTTGYAGKNMIALALGMKFQKDGLNVGYMKPVGAVPGKIDGKIGDEDAFFIQDIMGLNEDPELVTPVVITHDFKIGALAGKCDSPLPKIKKAYATLSKDKDIMILGGSGSFLHSGKYCGVDGPTLVKELGLKTILVDRYSKDLNYDYLMYAKEEIGDSLLGVIFNDVPAHVLSEVNDVIAPFLENNGIKVLGIIPPDPIMKSITIEDLSDRLGGKIISVSSHANRIVTDFLIGTMQVENFMTHFKKHPTAAIIVGGDRSDVQLVALEGGAPCLVLTGNLYPNDIILSRSEILGVPVIIVREDTYSVAKKMEEIQKSHKLRDMVKVNQATQIINANIDFPYIRTRVNR